MRQQTLLGACAALLACAGLWACSHPPQTGRASPPPSPAAIPAATAPLTDEDVTRAIQRGVDYLLKQKAADGTWEAGAEWGKPASEHGGQTALVVTALLQAGDSLTDDSRLIRRSAELAPSIKWLGELKPEATYVAALRAQVLARTRADAELAKLLVPAGESLRGTMFKTGGYTYAPGGPLANPDSWDTSNSHYAILGMDALAQARVEVPASYWRISDTFWRKTQNPDGGWGYSLNRTASSPATTAGGLESLLITREQTDFQVRLTPKPDQAIESALAAMQKDFDPTSGDYYYLYNVERVALRMGLAEIGTHDWCKEIAANLVATQKADGSWAGGNLTFWGNSTPIATTAYAVMILAAGRLEVPFEKLEYDGPWNARPDDVAHIAAWVSQVGCRPRLPWQTVSWKTPLELWQRSPVLVITGSKDPKFTDEQIKQLRDYVDSGGLIFSAADGAAPEFTQAMMKYAGRMVNNLYEFRELPPDHVLCSLGMHMTTPLKVLGLSNGVRELWIHCPVDLGATWQRQAFATKEHWIIAADVYIYADRKGWAQGRLRSVMVAAPTEKPVRTITMGRLDYPGNWNPEPGAWARFAKVAAATFHTKLDVVTVKASELDAAKMPLVHMTGTTAMMLPDADATKLAAYVHAGGTLFVDDTSGRGPFSTSFMGIAKTLLPKADLEPIPANDPLLTGRMPDGVDAAAPELRRFARIRYPYQEPPVLLGIKQNGRWVVIFSPLDITSGLLGTNTEGIVGYTPEYSEKLARNVVLYAGQKR